MLRAVSLFLLVVGLCAAGCDSAPSGGGTADAVTAKDVSGAPACADFCTLELATCKGALAQFKSQDECLKVCAVLPPGDVTNVDGNTAGCRYYHTTVAGQSTANATTHCPHTGAVSDTCGSKCDGFCALVEAACTGANAPFANHGECVSTCNKFPTTGKTGDTSGDTVQCRIYHATAAFADPGLHCGHTKLQSDTCK